MNEKCQLMPVEHVRLFLQNHKRGSSRVATCLDNNKMMPCQQQEQGCDEMLVKSHLSPLVVFKCHQPVHLQLHLVHLLLLLLHILLFHLIVPGLHVLFIPLHASACV